MKSSQHKGFTLLEILLVIAAIGILAAIVIVAINPQRQLAQVREAEIQSGQNTLKNALEQYLIETGGYPAGITAQRRTICDNTGSPAGCLDVGTGVLAPNFIASIPSGASYSVFTNREGNRLFLDRVEQSELLNCPEGYIPVPGNSLYGTTDFCVMKYQGKNVSSSTVSQPTGTPLFYITQEQAITRCESVGASLMDNNHWMTLARNIESVPSNWTGGAVGNGLVFRGHSDNDPASMLEASTDDTAGYFGTLNVAPSGQRRTFTLSNGEVIWDFSGNGRHWLSDTIVGTNKPNEGASGTTFQEWTLFADGEYGSLNYDLARSSNDSWNSDQGMGRYYAGAIDGSTYALARGGTWTQSINVGIYGLFMDLNPAQIGGTVRCVITP